MHKSTTKTVESLLSSGITAYQAGNYVRAKEDLEQAAAKGSADALLVLSDIYAEGNKDIPKDYKKTCEYLEQAAEKKELDEPKLAMLGLCYHEGLENVSQDYIKARKYYEQAAKKGNATALFSLGTFYAFGHGIPQDYLQAKEYWEQAASKGHPSALYNLGFLYKEGRQGVVQNYVKAREYFEQAAAKGDATALTDLGLLHEHGEGVPQDYTKAHKYYEQALANGDVKAISAIGHLYMDGCGVSQDYLKARGYFEQAATKGNATAFRLLGRLYEKGQGVSQDYIKARECYEQAVAKEDATALTCLGILYSHGRGVLQDPVKACEYYEQAVAKGNVTALNRLGLLYQYGQKNIAIDHKKAMEYYVKAIAKGDNDGFGRIAIFYRHGLGVDKDIKFSTTCEQAGAGDAEAKKTALSQLQIFIASHEQLLAQGITHYQEGKYSTALQYWQKAIQSSNNAAFYHVANLYLYGQGVRRDIAKARHYLEQSIKNHDAAAYALLGWLHYQGLSISKDTRQAKSYWQEGVKWGNNTCSALLSWITQLESAKSSAISIPEIFSELAPEHLYYLSGIFSDETMILEPDVLFAQTCEAAARGDKIAFDYVKAQYDVKIKSLSRKTAFNEISPVVAVEPKQEAQDNAWQIFLNNLFAFLKKSTTEYKSKRIFISYAWEADPHENAQLQERLKRLYNDLKKLGCEVFLDIMDMKGDVNLSMAELAKADRVLVVYTPHYPARLKEKNEKKNGVQIEYEHIVEKLSTDSDVVFILQLTDDTAGSLPHPLSAQPKVIFSDKDDFDYAYTLSTLTPTPGLLPKLFGIMPDNHLYQKLLSEYNTAKLNEFPSASVEFDTTIFASLDNNLRQGNIHVLLGLKDAGKTQLALAYANNRQSHYEIVYYLLADTQENLVGSLKKLLKLLNVPSSKGELLSLCREAYTALNQRGSYLLVFDGVDNLLSDIQPYLPAAFQLTLKENQKIIITSSDLCPHQIFCSTYLSGLKSDDAHQLCQNQLQDRYDADPVQQLIERANYLPGVLQRILAYIGEYGLFPGQYLQRCDEAGKLLLAEIDDKKKTHSAKSSSATTIHKSSVVKATKTPTQEVSTAVPGEESARNIAESWQLFLQQVAQLIKNHATNIQMLKIMISYVIDPTIKAFEQQFTQLSQDLRVVGCEVYDTAINPTFSQSDESIRKKVLLESDAVILLCTPEYARLSKDPTHSLAQEVKLLAEKSKSATKIFPFYWGNFQEVVPEALRHILARDYSTELFYYHVDLLAGLDYSKGILPELFQLEKDVAYRELLMNYRLQSLHYLPALLSNFFQRKVLSSTLKKKMSEIPYQILSGLGGLGKTQQAIASAHELAEECKESTIIIRWMAAENGALLHSFRMMAQLLAIPMKGRLERDWIDEIYHRLSGVSRWLLIWDNVTDYINIEDYLPAANSLRPGQHILMTTRSQDWDALPDAQFCALEVFNPDEAHDYFVQQLPEALMLGEARPLAKELGYLPLALGQAAAYMIERTVTIASYYQQYLQQGLKLLALRKQSTGAYPDTVHTTWTMAMDVLETQSLLAVNILVYLSYLSPDGFLRSDLEELFDLTVGPNEIDIALRALRQYSLITLVDQENRGYLRCHRLVQAVTRLQGETTGKQQQRFEHVIRCVAKQVQHYSSNAARGNQQVADQMIYWGEQVNLLLTYEDKRSDAIAPEWTKLADFLFRLGHFYGAENTQEGLEKKQACYHNAEAKGSVAILGTLGMNYYHGKGVAQDYVKAREYFEKASTHGEIHVRSTLGLIYYHGYGVAQDYVKARECFEQAVATWKGPAIDYFSDPKETTTEHSLFFMLGMIYYRSQGVPQDYVKARKYFEQAIAKGFVHAGVFTILGLIYQNGYGVLSDYIKAREYFEQAAAKEDLGALLLLGLIYLNGQGGSQDYVKAKNCFEQAAVKENVSALAALGWLYQTGLGVAQHYGKAREYFEQAAAKENSLGLTSLAELYLQGMGVVRDYKKAYQYAQHAKEKGSKHSCKILGFLYQHGYGVNQDLVKARQLYEEAATNKVKDLSLLHLALCCEQGLGGAIDLSRAAQLRKQFSEIDDGGKLFDLGWSYEHGITVKKNLEKARNFYKKAIEKGWLCARTMLERLDQPAVGSAPLSVLAKPTTQTFFQHAAGGAQPIIIARNALFTMHLYFAEKLQHETDKGRLADFQQLLQALQRSSTQRSVQDFIRKAPKFVHHNPLKGNRYHDLRQALSQLSDVQLLSTFTEYLAYLRSEIVAQLPESSPASLKISSDQLCQQFSQALSSASDSQTMVVGVAQNVAYPPP